MESDYIQVFTTVGRKEDADAIAKTLVEEKLAGCVQLAGPITSTYWWNGSIVTSKDCLRMAKTEKALYQRIEEAVLKIHRFWKCGDS
ncbi:MAG: divalent-cation tolerance protein CutA [Promethearchaeati archaeon SRVP18_Atabeyarchaeia-1]